MILPVAALLACGGGSDSTAPGTTGGTNTGGTGGAAPVATTAVAMKNIAFNPKAIIVAPGAAVTWTNSDGFAHTVTFNASLNIAGSGGPVDAGSGTTLTMPTTAGTYAYKCTIHSGMTGTVQVQ